MTDGLIIISIGGNCPVQAEGTVDGVPFYFRARGDEWRMNIGGEKLILEPDWTYCEPYGDEPFAAGWMDVTEALDFIDKAVAHWRREMRPRVGRGA
jgi:hypothetical protein